MPTCPHNQFLLINDGKDIHKATELDLIIHHKLTIFKILVQGLTSANL